jgi:serine/threonine-protein kinase
MTDPAQRLAAALAERYRIERELGAGGMATVYLAEDLRHDRKVALKVLRTDLAAVIGAERFLQEIRTTANLQHPHILPLHDSGQVDGTVFYVMPYIEGESLRDRLNRDKQLPVEDALRFAREVADALGYAHERGIIHRDIKPENILLQRGHALVADFGIALAASRTGGSRMTETGLSLGTPHYMSPEQAMGERELGPRSDVYALGCVCYEMLCGEPPFTGPTPQAIVARVMTEPPRSLRSQRQTVPEHVEAAVLQALEKLPADRFGSAAEFAAALGQPGFTRTTVPIARAVVPGRASPWKPLALGCAALAMLLAVALIALPRGPADAGVAAGPVMRFEVEVPDSVTVNGVDLTADGSRLLVRSASRAYLYAFADRSWTPSPIAELKYYLPSSISPDSRMVAFIDEGRNLKVAPLEGGAVRTLTQGARQLSWQHNGFIYFVRHAEGRDRILRVRPEGGALDELVVADDSLRRLSIGVLLPGGQLIYAEAPNPQGDRESRSFTIEVGGKPRPLGLAPGSWTFGYASTGHLLVYGRDAVHAVGFDAKRLQVLGAPVEIISPIPLGVSFSAGNLIYTGTPSGGPALFDRTGKRRELPGAIVSNGWGFGARVSPSGHAIAFWRYQSPADRWDVFTYRLPEGPLVRLTSDSAGHNTEVSWAPDGKSVRFLGQQQGRTAAFSAAWDGSGPVEGFLSRSGNLEALAPLPGGSRMVIAEEGRGFLLAAPGSPDSAVTLVPAAAQPRFPRISPDGRWLAYSAIELGRREVFVRPVSGGSNRWQVSRNGGNNPVWGRSGRELFFYVNDSVRVAGLGSGPGFQAAEPRALFRVDDLPDFSGFDVLPGDSLFVLYSNSGTERERIFVVANFVEELRRLSDLAAPGRVRLRE